MHAIQTQCDGNRAALLLQLPLPDCHPVFDPDYCSGFAAQSFSLLLAVLIESLLLVLSACSCSALGSAGLSLRICHFVTIKDV
jgi:hypothetical protein